MEENERGRILNMLRDGKITVDEADKLLQALGSREHPAENVILKDARGRKPKRLKVIVDSESDGNQKNTKVNLTIPISLIRAAGPIVLKNMPYEAQQKLDEMGIDIGQILIEIDNLVENGLDEDIVNVDSEGDKVRIYVE